MTRPAMHIFAAEPKAGTVLRLDDQTYTLVGVEPYVRKTDGQPSTLLEWETRCPKAGCGTEFRCKTPLSISSITRRCEAHRSINKPVKGKRRRIVKVRVEPA